MIRARQNGGDLMPRLPAVRGRYSENVSLAGITWLRVGGPAEVVFRPADRDDLLSFIRDCPQDVPVTVIGVASNLLVRDGGISGVVIRLGRAFNDIAVDDDVVHAGASAMDVNVALVAAQSGIGGLEFLRGIPGTIGGALKMNAGAYGRELKDVLMSAEAVDNHGNLHQVPPADLGLDYRHSDAPADWIFLGAALQGHHDDVEAVVGRMSEIKEAREDSQPVRSRTGGSTFKNPTGAKAWELIDAAGCRGLRRGGAMVSELHCNFLINTGGATASDMEALGEEVRRRVAETSGVTLEWEIRRIGMHAGNGPGGVV